MLYEVCGCVNANVLIEFCLPFGDNDYGSNLGGLKWYTKLFLSTCQN